MKRRAWRIAIVVVGMGMLVGCGGDVAKMLASNPELRGKIMQTISNNPDLTGQMMDQLLSTGSDSIRTVVMDKLMAHGAAVQSMMATVAKDQSMLDGVINLAVQDSMMREHVMTLIKGIQMGAARK